MSAGINILCYKSKTLANGEHPLMVRVCKDGKKKYVSLGISIDPKYWDFSKNRPKVNCPNKEQIEKFIINKSKVYNDQIIELKAENKDFTPTSLIEKVDKPTKRLTAGELFLQQIDQFKKEERFLYAASYK